MGIRSRTLCVAIVVVGLFAVGCETARADLIGHWELDGNALDSSGNALNGSIVGTATAATDRFGMASGALDFSNAGYVQIGDNALMQSASFSISVWFEWDALGTSDVDFLTGKAIENFEIHTGGGAGVDGIRLIPGNTHYNDTSNIVHSGWNHLVVTYDGTSTSRVYMDGVLVGTHVDASTGSTLTGDFFIGARGDGSYLFDGRIDDVRLYNSVLSQSDVSTLFNASPVPEPGTLALLGLGLIGVALHRRRRSAKAS